MLENGKSVRDIATGHIPIKLSVNMLLQNNLVKDANKNIDVKAPWTLKKTLRFWSHRHLFQYRKCMLLKLSCIIRSCNTEAKGNGIFDDVYNLTATESKTVYKQE